MKNKALKVLAFASILAPVAAHAVDSEAQTAILTAGTTVAGLAGAAGAAGVAVMVVIWGIRKASTALKAAK